MRPLPPPCLAGVIVLVPSAIRPRTDSEKTFYFLGARSPLGNGLFLADGLLEPVPIAPSSVSFFLRSLKSYSCPSFCIIPLIMSPSAGHFNRHPTDYVTVYLAFSTVI